MKFSILGMIAAICIYGCDYPIDNIDNIEIARQALKEAEKQHPEKDFGLIRERSDHVEYISMSAHGYSTYMTLPGLKSGGGWDYIIMMRDKKIVNK